MNLSSKNCGDHRIESSPTTTSGKSIEIKVDTLDQMLSELPLQHSDISLIWVDTQGHESHVLEGAMSCIKGRLPFFIEFWPHELERTGGCEKLLNLIESNFESFIEVYPNAPLSRHPVKRLRQFAKQFEGSIYHTDLLLLPR